MSPFLILVGICFLLTQSSQIDKCMPSPIKLYKVIVINRTLLIIVLFQKNFTIILHKKIINHSKKKLEQDVPSVTTTRNIMMS